MITPNANSQASVDLHEFPSQVLHLIVADGMQVCIDLNCIERVFPLVAVQAVPRAPHYLLGLMNLHGVSVPVIDLALKLGCHQSFHYDLDTEIVLCHVNGRRGALVVQQVLEIATVAPEDCQLGENFAHNNNLFKTSIVTAQGVSLLLDLQLTLAIGNSPVFEQSAMYANE